MPDVVDQSSLVEPTADLGNIGGTAAYITND